MIVVANAAPYVTANMLLAVTTCAHLLIAQASRKIAIILGVCTPKRETGGGGGAPML